MSWRRPGEEMPRYARYWRGRVDAPFGERVTEEIAVRHVMASITAAHGKVLQALAEAGTYPGAAEQHGCEPDTFRSRLSKARRLPGRPGSTMSYPQTGRGGVTGATRPRGSARSPMRSGPAHGIGQRPRARDAGPGLGVLAGNRQCNKAKQAGGALHGGLPQGRRAG
jgi:hypothetical protein